MSDIQFFLFFFISAIAVGLAFAVAFEVWVRRGAHALSKEYACNHSNCICGPGLKCSGTCIAGGDPWRKDCPQFIPTVGD